MPPMNVELVLLSLLVLERLIHYVAMLWVKSRGWPHARPSSKTSQPDHLIHELARLRGMENLEAWEDRWKAWETDHPMPPIAPKNTDWPDFSPKEDT